MAKKEETQIEISDMLEDGWKVAGYSVTVLHAGMHCHSVLLQKDNNLQTVTITCGKDEVGRSVHQLAPAPEKKKGLFS